LGAPAHEPPRGLDYGRQTASWKSLAARGARKNKTLRPKILITNDDIDSKN